MEFNIKTGQPEKQRTNCLILGIYEGGSMPASTAQVDKLLGGFISKIVKLGDIEGKVGQAMALHPSANSIAAERILLVGCGKAKEFTAKAYREAVQKMASALNALNISDAVCCLTELPLDAYDVHWKTQQAVVALAAARYKFEEYKSSHAKKKSKDNPTPKLDLKKVTWMVANKREIALAEQGAKAGQAIATGTKLTKDLAITPPNICTPTYLAKTAQKLAKTYKSVSTAILERKDIESLKMGAFLSVTQGTVQPPKLITLEYRGAAKTQQPIVLVGKGITYDTGGTCLKPGDKMIGMKFDMTGAASVLGLIVFAAELDLPINLIGVLAAAENMPGGTASRPDDIVTTMSGTTVEILNTDAEGRLVLCDALTYCERFNPSVVIDIATLTGSVIMALGAHHAGLFSNYQPLADELLAAGLVSGDKCWQMPLTEEYAKVLDSNVADIANVAGPEGASIIAASFLAKFAKKYHWAHLDVAGTACRYTGKDRGPTGSPIPLVAEYLLNKARYKIK